MAVVMSNSEIEVSLILKSKYLFKKWTSEEWGPLLRLLSFNPFVANAPFLYPQKTSENLTVFWCFQGLEKRCIGNKWVNMNGSKLIQENFDLLICLLEKYEIKQNKKHVRQKELLVTKFKEPCWFEADLGVVFKLYLKFKWTKYLHLFFMETGN